MTLYDDLGVPKDASPDEIKKAHRRGVKKHHPDTGGDREQFDKVQRAFVVLYDPARREKYDRTGETEQQPDNELAKVSELIMQAFDKAVQNNLDRFEYVDLADSTRIILRDSLRHHEKKIQETTVGLEALEKILRRVKYKGKKHDIIGNVLRQRIQSTRQGLDQMTRDKKMVEAAILYAKSFAYSFDQATYAQAGLRPMGFMNLGQF